MSRLANSMALYGALISLSIRAQMQYRVSFLLMSLGQFVTTGVEAVGLWALFARFGSLGVWSLPQVAMFYGVVNVSFAIAEAIDRGFDVFGPQYVRTGNFDRVLLRPRTTVLQLFGHELTMMRVGRLIQGLIVLVWAWHALDLPVGPRQLLLVCAAVGGAVCLFVGLVILQATLAFWTVESLEVMNTVTYGGVETAQYPLSIFQQDFRRFFTFVVPLGCVAYFPVVALMDVHDPLGSGRWLQSLAPLAGVLFLGGALLVWQWGVRRYTSTGS